MKARFALPALPLAGLCVALLTGCAASGGTPLSAEAVVAERAAARWQAIIDNQWPQAYQYTSPGYRAAVSASEHQGRTVNAAIRREAVEVLAVDCPAGASCEATLRLTYQPILPGSPRMSTDIRERWLEEGGQWYVHLPL